MQEGLNITEPIKDKEGPVIACIGSSEDFGFKESEERRESLGLVNVKNVDQESAIYDGEKEPLTVGPSTYIISPIDGSNKFSENFYRCTGLIVVGIDKKTGKNISFLSHQDPLEFLYDYKDKFIDQLKQQLTEIEKRCRQGTVSTVIVGGRYFSDDELNDRQVIQSYNDSIKLLGTIVEEVLKYEPTVINGPKTHKNEKDDIYFDNKNRRLYFIRPKINFETGDFASSNVDNQAKTWEEN
jgi:hypothetical protein